jgi:hypothetical protein
MRDEELQSVRGIRQMIGKGLSLGRVQGYVETRDRDQG